MPLNYLALEPQIDQYTQSAVDFSDNIREKMHLCEQIMRNCSQNAEQTRASILEAVKNNPNSMRCALPTNEACNRSFPYQSLPIKDYIVVASDGSQITPSPHDAVSVALINTSCVVFRAGSEKAPKVQTFTFFVKDKDHQIELSQQSDELISLQRDVAEMEALASWNNETHLPVVALGDGAIELFHQPREGEDFELHFKRYLDTLHTIADKGFLLACYTDRPRAALVIKMLECLAGGQPNIDLSGMEDRFLFESLIKPGERSAIFELRSSSSPLYEGDLALYFFYLNVGREGNPWIVRVEIPHWVAVNEANLSLVHRALVEQCRIMSPRPYPYLLYRAHEEAVVRLEEKSWLIARLVSELQQRGLGISLPSHKQSAKDLHPRRRTVQ